MTPQVKRHRLGCEQRMCFSRLNTHLVISQGWHGTKRTSSSWKTWECGKEKSGSSCMYRGDVQLSQVIPQATEKRTITVITSPPRPAEMANSAGVTGPTDSAKLADSAGVTGPADSADEQDSADDESAGVHEQVTSPRLWTTRQVLLTRHMKKTRQVWLTQQQPFRAGTDRGARHRPYPLQCKRRLGRLFQIPQPDSVDSVQVEALLADFAQQCRSLLGTCQATSTVKDGVGIIFLQRPQLTHQCISFRTRISRQDLQQAVDVLLSKGALERVIFVTSLGYYSRLFLVPKKTDLRLVGIRDANLHVPMHKAVRK